MRAIFYALVAVAVWSTAAPLAVAASVSVTPLDFVTLILLSATVSLFLQLALSNRTPFRNLLATPTTARWLVVFFGLLVAAYYLFLYSSIFKTNSIIANLINYLWPVFYALFAGLFLAGEKHKLSAMRLVFMGIGFLGVCVLIFGNEGTIRGGLFDPWLLVALLAAICAGSYFTVAVKLETYGLTIREVYFLGLLAPTVLALTASVMMSDTQREDLIAAAPMAVFLGAIVIPLGQTVWTRAILMFAHPSMSALSFLTPVLSTVLLIIFFDEIFTFYGLIGASLILLSALLVSRDQVYINAHFAACSAAIMASFATLVVPDLSTLEVDVLSAGALGTIFSILAGFTITRLADRLRQRNEAFLRLAKTINKAMQPGALPDAVQAEIARLRALLIRVDATDAPLTPQIHEWAGQKRTGQACSKDQSALLNQIAEESEEWLYHYFSRSKTGEFLVIAMIGTLSLVLSLFTIEIGLIATVTVAASAAAVAYIVFLVRDYERAKADRTFEKMDAMYAIAFHGSGTIWPPEVLDSPKLEPPRRSIEVLRQGKAGPEPFALKGVGSFSEPFFVAFTVSLVVLLGYSSTL